MRGKRCAGLSPMLLSAALFGAAPAAAETAPSPAAGYPATIVVLDASSSMNAKIGSATKIAAAKAELGAALGTYAGRLSFGLVALGHRKASNCADSETLAKPGELTFAAKDKLFDKIKPKGQAPIAAALSDAAKTQMKDQKSRHRPDRRRRRYLRRRHLLDGRGDEGEVEDAAHPCGWL